MNTVWKNLLRLNYSTRKAQINLTFLIKQHTKSNTTKKTSQNCETNMENLKILLSKQKLLLIKKKLLCTDLIPIFRYCRKTDKR